MHISSNIWFEIHTLIRQRDNTMDIDTMISVYKEVTTQPFRCLEERPSRNLSPEVLDMIRAGGEAEVKEDAI